jgi:predicted dithiol-disulfide oxidoreductase (DUF899 family)
MGWRVEWVSSLNSDFNYDLGVSYTDEERASGAEYEDNIPPGEWWWRRHDEYGDGRGGDRG